MLVSARWSPGVVPIWNLVFFYFLYIGEYMDSRLIIVLTLRCSFRDGEVLEFRSYGGPQKEEEVFEEKGTKGSVGGGHSSYRTIRGVGDN